MSDAAVAAELIALEKRRGQALVKRDAAALEALFTDDLVHIHSTGNSMTKRELIHYVTNILQFLTVARTDLQVKVYGNVAVMSGKMHNSMRRVDKPDAVSADALVTQVWVKSGNSWRQANFHACRAAEPGKN
jgi:ketosteroid isomerase-like protein